MTALVIFLEIEVITFKVTLQHTHAFYSNTAHWLNL